MMRYFALVLVMLTSLTASGVFAQDENVLEYGVSVQGEITNRDFEIEYSFVASAGDVFVITMTPEDVSDGLSTPSVILLDSEFGVISSVDSGFGAATLVHDTTQDGTYYILATRRDGRSGESVGAYTLNLSLAMEMTPGELIESKVDGDAVDNVRYFAVRTTSPVDIEFTKTAGDLVPQISINVIDDSTFSDSNLSSLVELSGEALTYGVLGIDPIATSAELHLVEVSEADFSFRFENASMGFTIQAVNPDR